MRRRLQSRCPNNGGRGPHARTRALGFASVSLDLTRPRRNRESIDPANSSRREGDRRRRDWALRRRGGTAPGPSDRICQFEGRTVHTQRQPLTSQIAASPRPQRFRAAEPRSRKWSLCCSVAMARLSPSLSPPPAGCRTRRGRRSPACASAAMPSGLIGPTRREGRSIGSSRRRWATIARRRRVGRRRLAKHRRRPRPALRSDGNCGYFYAPAKPRRFAGTGWWAMQGSNLRPLPCEGSALPLS